MDTSRGLCWAVTQSAKHFWPWPRNQEPSLIHCQASGKRGCSTAVMRRVMLCRACPVQDMHLGITHDCADSAAMASHDRALGRAPVDGDLAASPQMMSTTRRNGPQAKAMLRRRARDARQQLGPGGALLTVLMALVARATEGAAASNPPPPYDLGLFQSPPPPGCACHAHMHMPVAPCRDRPPTCTVEKQLSAPLLLPVAVPKPPPSLIIRLTAQHVHLALSIYRVHLHAVIAVRTTLKSLVPREAGNDLRHRGQLREDCSAVAP